VFIDETGASTNMARTRGRSRRGRRLRAAIPHGHYKTVTLVAGLRLRGLVAQKAFDRPINAAAFEEWVEKCLVPTLSKGDIVVMDNLSSHKGPRVEQLIKAAEAELRYLPPYSPDLSPIEKAYSKLKAFLRKIAERTVAGLLTNQPRRLRRYLQPGRMHKLLRGLRIRADRASGQNWLNFDTAWT
jgi:transposase